MKALKERNQQIIVEYQQGVKQTVIAAKHNISKQRVGQIIKDNYTTPLETSHNGVLRGLRGRVVRCIKSSFLSSFWWG